ncbi:cytochrome P450 [Suillus fuscotomentosus]|uniref:Cytochrome P450 n=1 Tax=Suillus fuscotomentosus TaxID=1912939 RepID=A0AAD4HFM6_9AGAM|nr:cytochrome P450 [Suillus fuscotomentosus]KAG1894747.1 cytochrome P450 [Suillus fuscotomentosus]
MAIIIACTLIIIFASVWIVKQRYQAMRRLPLPPGPPGRWLLGNTMPKSYVPFQFARWTEQYGPVFSLKQGRRIFVIIGRHQAAVDIMEKEGANLADRPRSISVHETLSGGLRMVLEGSGERLRRLRRVLHAGLQPKVAETYEPIQTRHAKNLVLDILNDPKNHQSHAMRYAASVVMSFTYGKITPTSYTDPEVVAVNKALARFGQALKPGAYLVDTYPILRFVPGYLSQLKAWHKEEHALYEGQLDAVRRQMREGTARPSFARFILEHQKQYQLEDKELGFIAGGMFAAGSDTTSSAITIMTMAAATHTDAQARVQEELDNVVGRTRLPTFDDQEMLPQVTAFMLESLRWRPVSLGGFAHRATKDIIWKNYLIPAGTTVIGNHWAIANDPEVFPEPHTFNPQRWIDDAGRVRGDLRFFTFGFGRRVCPGQHVANRSVFINTALILWAFRLSENPAAKINTLAFSDTANIHAAPFEICLEKRIDENVVRELCAPGK